MPNIFDKYVNGTATVAPPSGNVFDKYLSTPPPLAPTSPVAGSSVQTGAKGYVQPLTPNLELPMGKSTPTTVSSYGGSSVKDVSGKPLLTYTNAEQKRSQLLSDRTFSGIDPTVKQIIPPSTLYNPRMAQSMSSALRKTLGASAYQELDHLMPLELGGSNTTKNLQLERGANPLAKYNPGTNPTATDPLENQLKRDATTGKISVLEAWQAMAKAKGITLQENQAPATGTQKKLIDKLFNAVGGNAVVHPVETLNNIVKHAKESADTTLTNLFNAALPVAADIQEGTSPGFANIGNGKTKTSQTQTAANIINLLHAAASTVFLPVSEPFSIASQLPVIKPVADAIGLVFENTGKLGGFVTDKFVSSIPLISDQQREILRAPLVNVGTLAGQVVLGGFIYGKVSGLTDVKEGKTPTNADVIKIAEDAKQKAVELNNIKPDAPPLPPVVEAPKVEPVKTTIPKELQPLADRFAGKTVHRVTETEAVNGNPAFRIVADDGIHTIEKRLFPSGTTLSDVKNTLGLTEKTTIPKELAPLAEEARKYGSAEEFVSGAKRSGLFSTDNFLPPEYQDYAKYLSNDLGGGVKGNAPNAVKEGLARQKEMIDLIQNPQKASDFYHQATGEGKVTETVSPTDERAGFVNPAAALEDARKALEEAKKNSADKKFGTSLRTFFTGERDVRIAETNQLKEQLDRIVPNAKEQEALTLMRDFKNKPGELQSFLSGDHPSYNGLSEEAKAQSLAKIQKLEPIIKLAENPTANMLKADTALTEYFRTHLEEGKKLGFLDSSISNEEYISHLLTPKDEGTPKSSGGGQGGKISRTTPFSKERFYPTILDALVKGAEPKTLNALDALAVYGDKHGTAAATHILINELKTSELGKFGSRGSKNIPSDWLPVAPESYLFKSEHAYIDAEGQPQVGHQQLFAPEKVVKALRPITDASYLNRVPFFANARMYQAYLKAAELSLSVFHLKALNLAAIGNEGITGLIKTYASDIKSPEFLEQERNMVRAGGTSPILGRTIEAYNAVKVKSLPTRVELVEQLPGIKQVRQVAAGVSELTFGIVQRKMKVTDFALKDAQWMSRNPEATAAEHFTAQKGIAKEVNSIYGGLQWENMGVNKMTLELTKALLLAPDWTYSNIMTAKTSFEGGPAGRAARIFWVRSAITGYALTQGVSLLLSGQHSKDPTSVYLGKDKNGKEIYQNVFFSGSPGDMINLYKNIKDYGAVQGLAQSIAGKLGPIAKTFIQFATNRNYLGQTIVPKGSGIIAGTGRSVVNVAQNTLPIPFSVTTIAQMLLDKTNPRKLNEYLTTLAGGTRPRHVVPDGQRQVTSGKKKGKLVPATPRTRNSVLDIIKTGQINKPLKK